MSLNLKSEKAHRLAQELARLTGETMTAAVEQAVEERIKRVRSEGGTGKAEKLRKIAKASGPLWKEPFRSIDHGELLYDENGLPK